MGTVLRPVTRKPSDIVAEAEQIQTALAKPGLSVSVRRFLIDLGCQVASRPLTQRQCAAVQRIIQAQTPLDYGAINRAALARLPEVLERLLPGGRRHAGEWQVGSLRGEAGQSLRVRLHGERSGMWCDFATGEKGGDVISLAAAVAGLSQSQAARRLAVMLGVEA
jgi:hypothetical protein